MSCVTQPAGNLPQHDAAHRATETHQARQRAHGPPGIMSVGRVITRVDQDCWPKKARLKMKITQPTECSRGISRTQGMKATLGSADPAAAFGGLGNLHLSLAFFGQQSSSTLVVAAPT